MAVPVASTLLTLSVISITLTLIIFILAILDQGILSFRLNIASPILTQLWHAATLYLARRRRSIRNQVSIMAFSIACAYLLCLLWIVAFSVTTFVETHGGRLLIALTNFPFFLTTPATDTTQVLQCVLTAFEAVVMLVIAIDSTQRRERKAEKIQVEEKTPTPFMENSMQKV